MAAKSIILYAGEIVTAVNAVKSRQIILSMQCVHTNMYYFSFMLNAFKEVK